MNSIIPPPQEGTRGVVSLEMPRSVEAEAFRILRTNLELVNLERDATTIMVASGMEGEGKTTTVANLAVALAKAGKSVIAVDLDLRRPGLGKLFATANEPGITDVVLSRADLRGAIRVVMNGAGPPGTSARRPMGPRVPQGSLHYIGTGIVPPNPGEFIATHAVADLLDSLKKRADFVIVDSAPLLSVGDGIALMSQVDAVLIVSRLTRNRRPLISELKRVLESSPTQVLGVVVTDVSTSDGYGQYPSYGERPRERAATRTAQQETVHLPNE
jgi:Mrp family chromosome partitioning ATPase